MPHSSDIKHMRHALRLASHGLGCTWPNPSVGAVVVNSDIVVGTATTARGGRPHAETQALEMAAGRAKGAALYVTLEPCAYEGKTPPCTTAIIACGITRVIVACEDINPLVAGRGITQLRAAGIEVETGVCETEARTLNEGFFSVIERKRPFVAMKLATSLDGKIASASGESKWITGEESRRVVHRLRGEYDAILTSISTVLHDDPLLTCRLPGRQEDSPQRIIMDSNLRTPLLASALPAWIFTSAQTLEREQDKATELKNKGSSLFVVPMDAARLSLPETLSTLAQEGITRLLVETGSVLASEMMKQGLVDRLYWFRAPLIIGDKGTPALLGPHNDALPLAELPRFTLSATEHYGADLFEIYDCKYH